MDVDDFDAGDQALMKKPRPVGWFVAGLILVGSATVLGGYYLPLRGAHDRLVAEHKELAKKAGELDHSLKNDRALLASTEGRREQLQRFIDGGTTEEQARRAEVDVLKTTVERELAAFVKAKLLTPAIEGESLELDFSEKALFRPKTSALLPNAKSTMCKVIGALTVVDSWKLDVVVRSDPGDKKYWATATERAAALAETLESQCKFPAGGLQVSAIKASDEDDAPGGVALRLTLREAKKFSLAEAPAVEGAEPATGAAPAEQKPAE